MKLRLATREDIPQLRELIQASIRGLGSQKYNPKQVESSLRHLFGVDTCLIDDGTYFVVEMEEKIAGAGGWSRRKTHYGGDTHPENRDDSLRDPNLGDPAVIRAYYVHPDFARRGIARRIMQASERAAREEGYTSFELLATLPGVPLYEAMGYRHIKPQQVTLPDGIVMDGVHMGKP